MIKVFAWMLAAIFSFCMMAIGAREIGVQEMQQGLSVLQLLFWRNLLCLCMVVGLILLLGKNKKSLITSAQLSLHGWRNVFHFAAQYGWFMGISLLPLAQVFAIEFTVPLWTAIIAALFLKESISAVRWISITLGLAGVLIIVFDGSQFQLNGASLVVLLAAICFASAYTLTKTLTQQDSALSILFFMCLMQLPLAILLMFVHGQWSLPQLHHWPWLMLIAACALSAHFCVARAMALTAVSNVIMVDFLRLPIIALLGISLYGEAFEMTLLLGSLLILWGNWLNAKQQQTSS